MSKRVTKGESEVCKKVMKTIAENLAYLMETMGRIKPELGTAESLAQVADVHPKTIQRLLHRQVAGTSLDSLCRVSEAFGIGVHDFLRPQPTEGSPALLSGQERRLGQSMPYSIDSAKRTGRHKDK